MGSKQSVYKVVIIGMHGAGKTSYCGLLQPIDKIFFTEAFNYFEFDYSRKSKLQVWDLNGKHPHLWSHYMANVNGFIFVIDQLQADTDPNYVKQFIQELVNLSANHFAIGLAIIVNQHKNHIAGLNLSRDWFEQEVFSIHNQRKLNFNVFPMDLKNFKLQQRKGVRTQDQMALAELNESLHWLWFYCRHPPETKYKSIVVIETDHDDENGDADGKLES